MDGEGPPPEDKERVEHHVENAGGDHHHHRLDGVTGGANEAAAHQDEDECRHAVGDYDEVGGCLRHDVRGGPENSEDGPGQRDSDEHEQRTPEGAQKEDLSRRVVGLLDAVFAEVPRYQRRDSNSRADTDRSRHDLVGEDYRQRGDGLVADAANPEGIYHVVEADGHRRRDAGQTQPQQERRQGGGSKAFGVTEHEYPRRAVNYSRQVPL